MRDLTSDNSFQFEEDFDTMAVLPQHIARILLGDGSMIMLYFGPKGTFAFIRKIKDSKCVFIEEDSGETQYARI